ncbi:MAG: serine/threonine-protein kinase, partial [Myxococcota bacterium]
MDAREFNEAQNDPLIGTTVAHRYHILERVGTGGMGTVYRAKQEGLARHVALKVLKKDLTWESDTVTRFQREAKAMSLLSHPNTVRVYDFGQLGEDQLFFAMELVEGEVLTAKIERDGPMEVRTAVRIARQILGSLGEAHSKGIVHRDLKPDNIILAQVEGDDHEVVKVLDFGIAKVIQGDREIDQLETQAGTVFGTPRYMSPEQAQGKKLDPRSDLYSVGILLYHMLSGRAPFLDDDAVVVMAKHIREKAPALRQLVPERPIPRSLNRAVAKAMEKDREKRYAEAESFSTALKETLRDVSAVEALQSGNHAPPNFFQQLPRIPLAIG